MSIFELLGFILAVLSLSGPSIKIVQFMQAHIRSFFTIIFVIHKHLHVLEQHRRRLQDLRNQLIASQHSIPHTHFRILMVYMVQMENMFDTMHLSLLEMEQGADEKFHKFMNATKWAHECEIIESQLKDAENRLFFISMWFGNNTTATLEEYIQGPNNALQISVASSTRRFNDKHLFLFMGVVVLAGAVLVTTRVIQLHFDQY